MAAAETARLIASLELKDNFSGTAKKIEGSLGRLEKKAGALGKAAANSRAFAVGLGVGLERLAEKGIGQAIDAIQGSIKAASDLTETQGKVQAVFGASSASVLAFGKNAASALKISENAAEGAAATYGNLFKAMGLADDKSASMSISLVKLAADLASFNNIDPSEVFDKLRAGLTGESEPLKVLGVNINETILKSKALELGLIKTGASVSKIALLNQDLAEATNEVNVAVKKYGPTSKQALEATVKQEAAQAKLEATVSKVPGTLDAATKAQAAYALIFEQTAAAQGDVDRTGGNLAGQQRELAALMEDTGAVIGKALLPAVTSLVTKVNEWLKTSRPAIESFASKIPGIADKLTAIVGSIPWESVATSLKIAGEAAMTLVGAFASMPSWVQVAVVTGWGLNKVTGGLITDLASGLIKGVLGINAGVVNVKAATVAGVGGGAAGAAGAAGKGATIASAVRILGAVSIAAASIFALKEVFDGVTEGTRKQAEEIHGTTEQLIKNGKTTSADLQKALAATETGIRELQQNPFFFFIFKDALNELERQRDDLKGAIAQAATDGSSERAGIQHAITEASGLANVKQGDIAARIGNLDGTLRPLAAVGQKLDLLHQDFLAQKGILEKSTDPAQIAKAAAALTKDILAGVGSTAKTGDVLATLKTQRAAAASSGNTTLVRALDAAIKQIVPKLQNRQFVDAQLKILKDIEKDGTISADESKKLTAIQKNLLAHGDTHAAAIIGRAIKEGASTQKQATAASAAGIKAKIGDTRSELSRINAAAQAAASASRATTEAVKDKDLSVTANFTANITIPVSLYSINKAQKLKSRLTGRVGGV